MRGQITGVGTIKGALAARASLAGSLSSPAALSGRLSIPSYIDVDQYDGFTDVTPGEESQVLNTAGKVVTRNIVINPIPSNYGLITWNGSILTVS